MDERRLEEDESLLCGKHADDRGPAGRTASGDGSVASENLDRHRYEPQIETDRKLEDIRRTNICAGCGLPENQILKV
jgi:hypothetical protein